MGPFQPDAGRVRTDRFRRFGPLEGLARCYQHWNWSWRLEIALRYQPVVEALMARPHARRILDVGCGSKGGVTAYLHRPAYGVDITFDPERLRGHPLLTPVCASGLALPFADASLDAVICLDTIEHMTPAERHTLVVEMGRVVRDDGFVAVGAPCGPQARAAEVRLAEEFLRRTGRPHPKLSEHLDHAEMTCEELQALVSTAVGPRFGCYCSRTVPNTGLQVWAFLQRLTDLGRPLPGVTHVHRLLFQPIYPLLVSRLQREPAYRNIVFVEGKAA